jgi:hypothetical protein
MMLIDASAHLREEVDPRGGGIAIELGSFPPVPDLFRLQQVDEKRANHRKGRRQS